MAQQDARGTIVGRVTDVSGATVPGSDIRGMNVATGVAASAKTNDAGNFTLPYLLPGMYTVTAENAGFRKVVRENVQVRVGETVEVNVEMSVGDVTETVQVRAETPLLSTAEASLGQVVDERRILELPLFSGNAMEFALLAPGTVNGTDMRLRKAPFNAAPSQFSTDGNGMFNNSFYYRWRSKHFLRQCERSGSLLATASIHRRIQSSNFGLRRLGGTYHGLGGEREH